MGLCAAVPGNPTQRQRWAWSKRPMWVDCPCACQTIHSIQFGADNGWNRSRDEDICFQTTLSLMQHFPLFWLVPCLIRLHPANHSAESVYPPSRSFWRVYRTTLLWAMTLRPMLRYFTLRYLFYCSPLKGCMARWKGLLMLAVMLLRSVKKEHKWNVNRQVHLYQHNI